MGEKVIYRGEEFTFMGNEKIVKVHGKSTMTFDVLRFSNRENTVQLGVLRFLNDVASGKIKWAVKAPSGAR